MNLICFARCAHFDSLLICFSGWCFFSIPTANKWWTSARLWCLLENSCQNTQTIILLHARTCKYTCKLQIRITGKIVHYIKPYFRCKTLTCINMLIWILEKKNAMHDKFSRFITDNSVPMCTSVHCFLVSFSIYIRRNCLVHQDFIKMIMWNTREFDTVCAFRLVNK